MQTWSEVLKTIFIAHEQLVLGWLLGMLSPALVEAVRRRRRVTALQIALGQELRGLQFQMATKALVFRLRASKPNPTFLAWFDGMIAKHSDQPGVEESRKYLALLQAADLSKLPDPEPKRGFSLSVGEAPLLTTHTNEIAQFPIEAQKWLLRLVRELSFFNQQVTFLRHLFDKTFDSLSETNRTLIKRNLEEGYEGLAKRAVVIADLIEAAPKTFSKAV